LEGEKKKRNGHNVVMNQDKETAKIALGGKNMKMSFRYYGATDPIPLDYIRQIPNLSTIVSAVYDVKPGEIWPLESLFKLRDDCLAKGLSFEVVESIPVSEEIKLGGKDRDRLIANYCENIARVAKAGVKCVCYNFMPVFDWIRTNLSYANEDGSYSLSYDAKDFASLDAKNLHLPGWDESYGQEELSALLSSYKRMGHEELRDNLIYFLKAVIPVCEEVGVDMAIHPDDPPWDVFGLPRIASTEEDFDALFSAVPSPRNGLTFCLGSLAESSSNDVYAMAKKYAKEGRIKFAHLRNVKLDGDDGSFHESGHISKDGSVDMARFVSLLVENGFDGYVRPDHGRKIWGEKGNPGYGLYDRALGIAYLNGLFEMAEKGKK
jgi:mannonate dehydratase